MSLEPEPIGVDAGRLINAAANGECDGTPFAVGLAEGEDGTEKVVAEALRGWTDCAVVAAPGANGIPF